MNCLDSTSVSELPAHIMFDIFSRLPPNTIGRCRCVSKTWCNLLLDPHFVNLHLSKSPSCLMINEYKGQQSTILKLFEIDDELDHHHVHREPAITLQHGVAEKLYLQGSIDGLLCLWQFVIDDTYIFNPILREYVLLPKHKHARKSQAYVSYGFGFNPITRQYKVFRVFQGNVPCDPPSGSSTYVSECEVYTLGTNTWRSVGNVPFSIGVRGVFVNGGFHGLSTDIPEMIARIDLETESFQTVCSTPPPLNRDALYLISLVELGGCLCICDNSSDSELVIWVMKEYGVEESWTKEIVISRNYIPDWVGYEAVCPFKILKDGSILMLWRDDRLITYCPRTKAFEELDIGMSNYDTIYEAENYVPSIISLKNIILEKVQVF